MGRWRPPAKPGSKYITPEGAQHLRDELDHLWRAERPRVTQAVSEAAAQGDRSENAEYIYGKKQLYAIDRRIRFLTKRLDGMVVVDQKPDDPERVFFGAWVTIQYENGTTREFRIVGPDESDASKQAVSMDAPMGQALLGKKLDDEITVKLPEGEQTFLIIKVCYE
ncbi:MAG: transcription elongation factor GreB [Gammaproteobacteria bacterium]